METHPKKESVAIYAGSFDPITNGHVDLIQRALTVFNKIIVLVAHTGKKSPLFTAEERKELVESCFPAESGVEVEIHEGLLVDYARERGVRVVLRGLRAVSDFDYEFQMATMNRRMYAELQNFFLMSTEKYFFVNSTLVKEVVSHGGNVSELVPPQVEERLKERLCGAPSQNA